MVEAAASCFEGGAGRSGEQPCCRPLLLPRQGGLGQRAAAAGPRERRVAEGGSCRGSGPVRTRPRRRRNSATVGGNLQEIAPEAERSALRARALHWFRQAAPNLTGLTKAWVDRQIATAEEDTALASPRGTDAGRVTILHAVYGGRTKVVDVTEKSSRPTPGTSSRDPGRPPRFWRSHTGEPEGAGPSLPVQRPARVTPPFTAAGGGPSSRRTGRHKSPRRQPRIPDCRRAVRRWVDLDRRHGAAEDRP